MNVKSEHAHINFEENFSQAMKVERVAWPGDVITPALLTLPQAKRAPLEAFAPAVARP